MDDISKAINVFEIVSKNSGNKKIILSSQIIKECIKMLGKTMSDYLIDKWMELYKANYNSEIGVNEFLYLSCNFKPIPSIVIHERLRQKSLPSKIQLPCQDINQPVRHFVNSFAIEKPDEDIQKELNKEISKNTKITINHQKPTQSSLFKNQLIEKLKINPKKDGKTIYIEDLTKLKFILRKDALYSEMKWRLRKSNKRLNVLRNCVKFSKGKTTKLEHRDSEIIKNVKSHPYYSVIERNLRESFKSYFKTPNKMNASFL